MSKEEKEVNEGIIRIATCSIITLLMLMSCFCAIMYKTPTLYITTVALFEFLILFLYFTNKPLITNDICKSTYYKIIYEMPNYKNNLSISYNLIGLTVGFFVSLVMMKYKDMVTYKYFTYCFYGILIFWLIQLVTNTKNHEPEEISLSEIFDIFNNNFNLNNIDNKTKIEKINLFKYEIQFNKIDFVEFSINLFKKVLTVIGLVGLTNLIKDISFANTSTTGLALLIFIYLDFIFSDLQKSKNQIFYALDLYIEKLKDEIEEEEKQQQNKIKKRRTRKKIN